MKKQFILLICAFAFFSLSAQVSDDFSDYNVGEKIAEQAQAMGRTYWTTWNDKPGSNEDAVVGEIDGKKCGEFEWLNGKVDQILKLGGKTSGTWDLSLKILIPTGECAFFNVLADFDGPRSKWAFQIYFNKAGTTPGVGTMDAGGASSATFSFQHDTWIPVKLHMNLDADEASVIINDVVVHSWTYTDGTFGAEEGGCPRVIDALDIYPHLKNKSLFYITDIVFEPVGGPTAPALSVSPTSLSEVVIVDDADVVIDPISNTITISNSGTSIGDFLGWLKFGEGEDGEIQNLTLTFSDEIGDGIGLSSSVIDEPTWMQIATMFPASFFCDKIGTYITKISYYVPYDLGDDPLIFRILGPHTDNTGPGKLLVETTLNDYIVDDWNEVTLPEPFLLEGREIWLSVQFTHLVGAYPIACDGKPVPKAVNWFRFANYSWMDWGEDWGDFMIKGLLEGKTKPACWIYLNGNNYGSVLLGSTKTFDVVMDANGLELGEYSSTLMLNTNDPDHPLFEIPCTLTIKELGIETYTVNGIQTTIFPNPASDLVNIESNTIMNSVQLVNQMGQVVYSSIVNSERTSISTSNLSTGIYFVKVNAKGNSYSIKLVVK